MREDSWEDRHVEIGKERKGKRVSEAKEHEKDEEREAEKKKRGRRDRERQRETERDRERQSEGGLGLEGPRAAQESGMYQRGKW